MKYYKEIIVLVLVLLTLSYWFFKQHGITAYSKQEIFVADNGGRLQGQPVVENYQSRQKDIVGERRQSQSGTIYELNQQVRNEIDGLGYSRNPTVLDEIIDLTNDIDTSQTDIRQAVESIVDIKKNPQSKSLVIRELYSYCDALKRLVKNTNNELERLEVRGKYFLIALHRSGYCLSMGTRDDPFFQILRLAREGDQLAQLFLIEDFHKAMQRQLIKPKLYPIEYNDLRNEVIAFLEQLSNQGVEQATLYLAFLYDNSESESELSQYLPENKMLHYVYLMKHQKQSADMGQTLITWKNPSQVYETLSDKEKAQANRMLKNIIY